MKRTGEKGADFGGAFPGEGERKSGIKGGFAERFCLGMGFYGEGIIPPFEYYMLLWVVLLPENKKPPPRLGGEDRVNGQGLVCCFAGVEGKGLAFGGGGLIRLHGVYMYHAVLDIFEVFFDGVVDTVGNFVGF